MTGRTERPWKVIWALILACLLVGFFSPSAWCSPEYRSLTILYTNDTHDHLLPFSYPEPLNDRAAYADMPARKNIGGIARRATLVKRIRAETRGNALLLDGGDIMEGTPIGMEYGGKADFAAMSAVGYDAAVPGNHDFRISLDGFYEQAHSASFPLVCANVLDRKTGKPALPEYLLVNRDGMTIAVLGITVPSPEYQAGQEGLDFLDPFETAKRLVPELRKQADVVIVLSHLGFGDDQRLAKEVPGIDVIVGGHSHSRLATPRFIPNGSGLEAFSVGGTIIVQGYEHGAEFGRLDLRLRRDDGPFTVMSYTGRLIPVTSDIPDDPTTAKVVDSFYRPISKRYGELIGKAEKTLYNSGESAVLNLICDSIREASGARIGMYGIGGVRGDIIEGPIRVWDIANVIPYAYKIVVLELTGEQVKQILVRFPIKPGVSGMRYHMVGNRIVEATVDGKQLDDKAVYKLATIEWLVGLYFKNMPEGKTLDITAQQAVVNYVRARKTISPVTDGRRNAE